MIKIDLLKNHSDQIDPLSNIWYQVLGRIWAPDLPIAEVKQRFIEHLNENKMPLTLIALQNNQAVGMCSLRENDGIRPDLTPWLGSLVVDPNFQKQGIGGQLVNATKEKARLLGYKELFLFALDPSIPNYYKKLGWQFIEMEQFKGHPVTVMKISL